MLDNTALKDLFGKMVTPVVPGSNLVSVRAIRGSPFAQQADWVFFAGYDANKMSAHNIAWIIRGTEAAAISGP